MSTKRKKEEKQPKSNGQSFTEALEESKIIPIFEIHCKCNRECKKLDIPYYRDLFKKFNNIPSKNLQGTYLLGLISIRKPLRRYTRKRDDDPSKIEKVKEKKVVRDESTFKRQVSVYYTVPTAEGTHLTVCRKTFCNIFGVSDKTVETLTEKKKAGDLAYIDKRGKYNHKKKFGETDVQLIKSHVNSVSIEVTREDESKPSKETLGCDLSLRRLFDEFKEMHTESAITYRFYYETIKAEFPDLKFKKQQSKAASKPNENVSESKPSHIRHKIAMKSVSCGSHPSVSQLSDSQCQFMAMDIQQPVVHSPNFTNYHHGYHS
ncbi:hypothetical protein CHUAL_001344 [Chamberlinius hualienensis]